MRVERGSSPGSGPAGGLREHWPVAAFTAVYLAAAVMGALARRNQEFLFYIAVMLVLIALVLAVHRSVGLSSGALWGLSVWGLLHMAGGLLVVPEGWPVSAESRVLYTLWLIPDRLKYDQVVHAYGFGMTTWVCWQALRAAIRRRGGTARPSFGLMVLCAAAGLGFGALNEVVEFVATLLIPETNVGGYRNTGWDLVANTVGASLAVLLISLGGRTGSDRSLDGDARA
ncbi:MAG: DUF2238 domain-containing protein [Gemmatimonadota bacterium]|jgi:uncharacterized membrane protein YjdF|nr:MAG: DUF2238 domain-containing protein [Gemmatimonadota bacterium]